MKIHMIAEISGTREGQPWPKRGEVLDVSKEEAEHMIAAGLASASESHAAAEVETRPAKKAEKRG